LDEITGNDIVTRLARIVTGEVQLETPNLQQAFAEANASVRQANTIIGDYEVVDDAVEDIVEIQTRATPRLFPTENGTAGPAQANGKINGSASPLHRDELKENREAEKPEAPPVRRPRLLSFPI
jgi:hypothetical protein